MKLTTIAVVALLGLSACAFTPQKAVLNPTLNVAESKQGQGITVGLRVVDERTSKSLGHRGTAYGAAAEITSEQDVTVVIHDQLAAGLKKKGYEVVDYDEGKEPRLTVEVRALEYSTSQGFWTGGVEIQGAMKAIATRGGKTYEKMYRTDKKERVVVVPTAKVNEGWINQALTETLDQLFADDALFNAIAGR